MTRSLRKALLLWLLLPAGLAVATFLPLAYHLIHQPAVEAFDQALADAGLALVPHLDVVGGEPRFVFPAAAEQVLRTDRVDEIYFLVLGPNQRFIAGDIGLPHATSGDDESIESDGEERINFDSHFRGHPIRVSTLRRTIDGESFLFVTAETTRKRDQLRVDLTFALVLPLLFFAGATGLTIWFGIRHALLPVEDIRAALKRMGHRALQPLDSDSAPTEIRPLVEEFNLVLDRLDQASAAQQRFVANAAHQLRTPLAGVRTQLELLQRETDADARAARCSQCISAIERLGHLVNQMLVLLSAEPSGRHADLAAPIDVPELIRERSPEWIRLAETHRIDLGFELQPACVRGDNLLLGEAIANLVINAIHYTPADGEVTIRCRQQGHDVFIEVEDNGPGIPLAARESIFERFFRLPGTGGQGSGLGLAIVREIARGFGGEVHALAPTGGRGARLQVRLPGSPPAT
ncbi:MAG: sensor histidine kinase [Proteobacteria bacterium]|nr:sensor histidine kinase [Pseudomonadota bacterium]